MIALDTNVVVRLITEDDPAQVARARRLILQHGAIVQTTVLLESEWVLRSAYRFSRQQIIEAFKVLASTSMISIEDEQALWPVLDACAAGMDFADAVHLVQSLPYDAFATFDENLVAGAKLIAPNHPVFVP